MPTPFGHTLAVLAIERFFPHRSSYLKVLLLGIFCSCFPDADVLGLKTGLIPYGHWLGHRGFTHSLFFSVFFGAFIAWLFFPKERYTWRLFWIGLFLIICTFSHALFDAMTSGGYGVALWAPFDNDRHFLPWRPIRVAPLSLRGLMSDRGMQVLLSEWRVIGIPSMIVFVGMSVFRFVFRRGK